MDPGVRRDDAWRDRSGGDLNRVRLHWVIWSRLFQNI
jgi:hypothetical protein